MEVEVAGMIDSWKKQSYPVAWAKLQEWGQMVYNPGWIENPWGRRKWAVVRKGEQRADLERQFSNFPIQSTVADTVQIASDMLLKRRDELGLQFKLQNQIHDALMLELPMEEKEICQQLLKECMANIWIPVQDLNTSFKLDIDIDLYERWGVKMH